MNPWPLLGAILGWTLLVIVALFLVLFIVLLLIQAGKALTARTRMRRARRRFDVENKTGRPESVLSSKEWDDLVGRASNGD